MINSEMTGGCQCGAIRYKVTQNLLDVYVCHCSECRKQSASAFGISCIVASNSFSLTEGSPKKWTRSTDSGGMLYCYFCANCGSRVWHSNTKNDDVISIKGGSLDKPVNIEKATHIWTNRKLSGIFIPENCKSFPEEPLD